MSMIPSFFGGRRSSVFDPFATFDLSDPFDFHFPSSISSHFPEIARETSAIVNARVDWKETPEAHVLKADLPGLKKEEVKVEIEDGKVIQISGERSVEKEDKNEKWHRMERSSGKFKRRFRMPEDVKMEEIRASMENGVLTVTVPKAEEKKADVKSVEISG
ncbi:18.5 kDa class I heat shock protein-like [Cucumis melo var. makuwa]|uniref:18.5 kDa class I heat shock protein-like n=2 Tax=Cucumis melo TaxID=3656 RepID=A0A1S3C522_CUCME|nr:18.5 kDa class I heat shock protein-like [Cucumis melo]KAA0031777.1 18.5 kDa class I heat shock protein-like [Cucumis melo var. makuwa]TYJ97355.1 18.5 kDa class I heat shock protein-like [Cucumis melo var. makuwa]